MFCFFVTIIVYLNDIIIYSINVEIHVDDIKWIFNRFKKNKLYIVFEKCKWFVDEINFFEFVVSFKKIRMQNKKIEIIQQWFVFRNVFDIMQFLDIVNFYRRFIKHFNKIVEILIIMLKKSQKFILKHEMIIIRIINNIENRTNAHWMMIKTVS